MPDIFLYPSLAIVTDIRLCDPTALCQAVSVPASIAGKARPAYQRKRKQRDWEPDPAWKNVELDAIAAVAAGPAGAEDDAVILQLLEWEMLE